MDIIHIGGGGNSTHSTFEYTESWYEKKKKQKRQDVLTAVLQIHSKLSK